jgi:hypothetical protein
VVGRWQVDPRVCQVAALPSLDAEEGCVGSGVLLESGRLLTARHVIAPAEFEAVAWRVRLLGTKSWLPSGQPKCCCATSGDLAVLTLQSDGELPVGVDAPRSGRLAGADEHVVRAGGVPRGAANTHLVSGEAQDAYFRYRGARCVLSACNAGEAGLECGRWLAWPRTGSVLS